MTKRKSTLPACDAPGCDNPAPVTMYDRNGDVSVCYGHDDNGISAIRAAMAEAQVSA